MNWMQPFRSIARRMPAVARLLQERDRLRTELQTWQRWQEFPPGHFHSPIPRLDDLNAVASSVFDRSRSEVPGVDLQWERQEALFRELSRFYPDLPFTPSKSDGLRYYYENGFFSYADGILLFCLLRHIRPRRIVEVGSGFSSCVILDTAERYLENQIECTFIEPEPQRLRSRLTPNDQQRVTIREECVQDVELSFFDQLEAGDILLIDSSHVGKINSDLNFLLFDVLPRLRAGVYVHFHDIFYPFEYPSEWVFSGRSWNEAYFVRAFLQFNRCFEIVLWGHALSEHRRELLTELMPLCMRNTGASLWVQRTPVSSMYDGRGT